MVTNFLGQLLLLVKEKIKRLRTNRKYCQECAKEIKKQQNKIADKKYKAKIKRARK